MFGYVEPARANFIELIGEIVSAYLARNNVLVVEIPALLNNVHAALTGLARGTTPPVVEVKVEKPTPAQIRKSVQEDGITSFIDGKSYKTLKRHLTSHGLDPRRYRERYGLPADYPMVAPSYAEKRSALAKAIGLGRLGSQIERVGKGRKGR